jgi:hypothetical protein
MILSGIHTSNAFLLTISNKLHKLRKKSEKCYFTNYLDFLATLPFGTLKLSTPSGTPHNTLNCPPAPPQTILTPFVAVLTIFVGVSISPEGFSGV